MPPLRASYEAGHIPGACYLDLNRDLSSPVQAHGGRHPLPQPQAFAQTLARCGIGSETAVVAYDDSRFAFASRLSTAPTNEQLRSQSKWNPELRRSQKADRL